MTDHNSTADVFDDKAAAWATWQAEPWGRLRYELVAHTLTRVLPERAEPLRVIDVGGGDGADCIPLARAVHEVTIVDYAGELLKTADAVAAAEGLSASVRTVCADLDDLEELQLDGVSVREAFDVVLCHNVIHYRHDVAGTVQALVRLLRAGGIVSIMAPNPAMDVLSAAVRRSDPQAALDVLDAETVHGQTFDHPVRRVESNTVVAALVAAGCRIRHRFGIRCVMDLLVDDDLKRDPDFYARLTRLERVVCEREPFWRLGRFWQVTARRAS